MDKDELLQHQEKVKEVVDRNLTRFFETLNTKLDTCKTRQELAFNLDISLNFLTQATFCLIERLRNEDLDMVIEMAEKYVEHLKSFKTEE